MDGDSPRGDRTRPAKAERSPDSVSTPSSVQTAEPASPAEPPRKRRLLPFLIFGVLLLIGAVAGGLWWMQARHFEQTDDAFIDTNISQVSAQVAGRTLHILVDDNQLVKAGQVLLELDPRDWQARLDQAEAQRGSAAAQVTQAQAMVGVQQAALDQAQANVTVAEADQVQAQQDFNRFKAIDPRAVSRQQVDDASARLRSGNARLEAARQNVAGARAQLESARAQVTAAQASLRNADVGVENAQLQLSYTEVRAPQAGRVAKRSVEPGNYVTAGQALMAIVPTDFWVTANFKETQLTDMHPGQPVAISIDAYPGTTYHAKVASFQAGTGSVFSALPVENATGNGVKVLQRVPVKIVFDDDRVQKLTLSAGMSVSASVTVR